MRNYLRIGEIISLHGIKGEVKVYPATDDVRRYDDLKSFYIVDSIDAPDDVFNDISTYEKEGTKYIKNTVILKIKGIDTIEDARNLIKKNIYVKRIDAVKLKDNEYFIVDLIGMSAYLDDKFLGEIVDVMRTKAHDILVVSCEGKEILIPFVDVYVSSIDRDARKVRIISIEGLAWKFILWHFSLVCLIISLKRVL